MEKSHISVAGIGNYAALRRIMEIRDKKRLIDYLERFMGDLVRRSDTIARLIIALELRIDALLAAVAEREARDAAPGGTQNQAEAHDSYLQTWKERWRGLRGWFLTTGHEPPQAELLRARARAAIPQLLAAIAALNERRSGRSDRSADFRRLARWFADCPSDAEAHLLARAAFALNPARHFSLNANADADLPASTSWADAPPLMIHPRLRTYGEAAPRGPLPRSRDRTADRAYLAQQFAAETSQIDAAAAAALTQRAEAVLRRLPAQAVTRSRLAAESLGDPHALDASRPTATLVLAAWRHAAASSAPNDDDPRPPDTTERTRDVWASAGVLVNELARPALFLNLPAANAHWVSGEPAYASLRSLLRSPPNWQVANRHVYVCENPNLLSIAADHWGPACAPLVCTDGMPAAAQRCLLSQLTRAGAQLHYHGDFDWPGLIIANHVIREHAAQPWRLSTADYLAATHLAARPVHALAGKSTVASWDPTLTPAMLEHQISIAEEAVAAELLQDLGSQ